MNNLQALTQKSSEIIYTQSIQNNTSGICFKLKKKFLFSYCFTIFKWALMFKGYPASPVCLPSKNNRYR